MNATARDVIGGGAAWAVEEGDCVAWLDALPEASVDLVCASPPYENCRTYGIDFSLKGQGWVDWMVRVCEAARRVCKGLCVFVLQGKTEAYRWSATPALLTADLHRKGFHLRNPPLYRRVGIPGSGGPDWLRSDYEWCVCFTRGGRLPWSDNTACGHPPKWGPGGAMSNRLASGARVNQWGDSGKATFRQPDGKMTGATSVKARDDGAIPEQADGLFGPAEGAAPARDEWGMQGGSGMRRANGKRREHGGKQGTRRRPSGEREDQSYNMPTLANPGNVIEERYTASEVADMLGAPGDVVDCLAGGGQMGSALCHENEAPFPLSLAEFFVLSFCPPGGIVADCFAGSGTSLAVAVRHGRRAVGCDLRASQVALTRRRVSGETPSLFGGKGKADGEA